MRHRKSRRRFLQSAAWGGVMAGWGDLGFLSQLKPVTADETKLERGVAQVAPEIEPLVRLLEETPREQLLEAVATRIRQGTSYREILAALLLAGVRNVQPRPSVGFKFHAVLVVNSAHLASLSSPDEHRWLPIFWALDHFKEAQAQDAREGDWTMAAVDESRVPRPSHARQAVAEALDRWDPESVDSAVAGLARGVGANDAYELFFRYGARDFRDIGHKAIFVANSRRTLECIGWQHAEPVLRSLAYALTQYDGDNPAHSDHEADRPWRANLELAPKLRGDWLDGQPDAGATQSLLAALRASSPQDACQQAVELVNRGVAVQSLWDALHLGAAELLVRQPGIVALHAVTSTNALRYAFESSAVDDTRRMLLLQNVAFVSLFRQAVEARGRAAPFDIATLTPESPAAEGEAALGEIFADVSRNRMEAARKIQGYLAQHPDPQSLINTARVLVFLKGTNSHDYKFSSALLEDYFLISPEQRARYLAAGAFQLRGSGAKDNPLSDRTRAALA